MDIKLLVTKTDFCLPNLECELKSLGINYRIEYIENNSALVDSNKIRHSPNIFVDDQLVFRKQPTPRELKNYFF